MSRAGNSQEPRSSLEGLPKFPWETSRGSSALPLEASQISVGDISGILGGPARGFRNFPGRHLGDRRRRWRSPEGNAQDFGADRSPLVRKNDGPKRPNRANAF